MRPNASTEVADRVVERRRAVALACHYREVEGRSIRQIAQLLGRSPATVKAYFYDPTGEKARASEGPVSGGVPRLRGVHPAAQRERRCLRVLKACHPGAIERRWTRERVLDAMLDWRARYGRLPSSYDWSRTHAHRRGGEQLERLSRGDWPSASVVTGVYGSWKAARAAATEPIVEARDGEPRSPNGRS